MAITKYLFDGRFYLEALKPWREAFEFLLAALAWRQGLGEQIVGEKLSIEQIQQLINQQFLLTSALPLSQFLRENFPWTEDQMQSTWRDTQLLMQSIGNNF